MRSYITYHWVKAPEGAGSMSGLIGLIHGLAVYRASYALMDTDYGIEARSRYSRNIGGSCN